MTLFTPAWAEAAPRVYALDGSGHAWAAGEASASLERTPPERVPAELAAAHGDPDALRYVLVGADAELPSLLEVVSLTESGAPLDLLEDLPLVSVSCPDGVTARSGESCAATQPVRAVIDEVDARHPLVQARSVLAELGGTLTLRGQGGESLVQLRVTGPRQSALGPIGRYRAKLRVALVRLSPGGSVPIGGDEEGAREATRAALYRTNQLWGACGISFGPPSEIDLRIVDPPPAHLVSLGCDYGLPASGGTVRLRVGTRTVSAKLEPGMLPSEAARRVARALEDAGLEARVSDNPRMAAGAYGSSDVSVRRRGKLVALVPPEDGVVSSDATMTACIGHVNLEDGLQHFGDVDAAVGTLEERTLLRAIDEGDPRTIEVILVPGFASGGRIGESFIGADGGTLRNIVLLDRAAVRAQRSSFALAHELGHVLLDDPGHPDDYGVDVPTQLMDADAASPTAFGPRRLSVEECERALRQSGPDAPVPILAPWPITPFGTTGSPTAASAK